MATKEKSYADRPGRIAAVKTPWDRTKSLNSSIADSEVTFRAARIVHSAGSVRIEIRLCLSPEDAED
jgi:hypothetical protein